MPGQSPQSSSKPLRTLKDLAKVLGALLLVVVVFALGVSPIVYFAKRDAERDKPLIESLGPDLQAIEEIIPMLAKGSTNNPPVVKGRVLFLKPDTWIYGAGEQPRPTKWKEVTVQHRALEFNSSGTRRLPKEKQATAEDIRQRQPVTIFVVEEWSEALGTYGKGGPAALETHVKVSVVPWPDVQPAHVEEFLMLPPGSVTSKPGGRSTEEQAAELQPAPGQMHYVHWIEQQVGAKLSKFETHDWFKSNPDQTQPKRTNNVP